MTYAEGTGVTVERSRSELEALLSRYGAGQRVVGSDDAAGLAFVVFRMADRQIRLDLPLPKLADVEAKVLATPGLRAAKRTPEGIRRAHEQACRERWRAMVLLVKAKLESIAMGISTVEREFLADVFLPDGRTVHQALRDELAKAYVDGKMPPLLGSPQ